jgi:hypothetical protein
MLWRLVRGLDFMDDTTILNLLQAGKIGMDEVEHCRKPKKRGRPKSGKPARQPKKNGRPRKLSVKDKRFALMAARVALDIEPSTMTAMEKRAWLCEKFCVSEKQVDAAITELNKRANAGGVHYCLETGEISFVTQDHVNRAFFNDLLSRKQDVHVRGVPLARYDKSIPKKPLKNKNNLKEDV